METRQGDGTEALSQETESNGSATPKSRRLPLTLPGDTLRFAPRAPEAQAVMPLFGSEGGMYDVRPFSNQRIRGEG